MWCYIIDLVVVGKWLFLLFHEMTWIVFVTSLFAALFILLKDNSIIVSASVWYHPREKIRDNPNFPRMLFNLTKIKFSFLIYLTFKELHGSRPLMPFRYHWKYHCITVPSLNMYNVQRIFILLSALIYLSFITMLSYQLMADSLMQSWEWLALSLTSQEPKVFQGTDYKAGLSQWVADAGSERIFHPVLSQGSGSSISQLWKLKLPEQANVAEILFCSPTSVSLFFQEGSVCSGKGKMIVWSCLVALRCI